MIIFTIFIITCLLGLAACARLLWLVLSVSYSVHQVQRASAKGMPIPIPARVGGVQFIHRQ